MPVKDGYVVKVDYVGTLEDGTVFDSSEESGKPIVFQVGKGMVIDGFNDAVKGMEVGDKKDVTIPPEQAYGDQTPSWSRSCPRRLRATASASPVESR